MEKLTIPKVIQLLNEAGITAVRAKPGGKMPSITGPAAAVALERADLRQKELTLTVAVMSPEDLGAAVCEETALAAGEVLTDAGGKCSVGKAECDGRTGLFRADVTALFLVQPPKITIGETPLQHVQAFTSWRALDEEQTDWTAAKWNFRLEEYFPVGEDEDANPAGAFTLIHTSAAGTESYLDATWTYQRRVWDASGVRQIRLGVAQSMDNG